MDAARLAAWLGKTGRALPWPRIGVAAGVAVVGISQVLFSLLTHNADYFPKEPWFHVGVLVWATALPFALILALDLAASRWAGRGFAVWRAALYTFLFASLLRQAQVYYPAPFQWVVERIPPRPPMYGLLALVFFLCIRSKVLVHRYAAAFGVLAVMLLTSYAWKVGLLGEAWRASKISVPAASIGWKDDPVLICVFDELTSDILRKGDAIDAERFPNFAALAADSAYFPNAWSNHMFTKDSFPCMLTGRLQPADGTPKLFDYLPPECGVIAREYFPPTYGWLRKNARAGQTFLLYGRKEEPLQDFVAIPGALYDMFLQTPFSRSPFAVNPGRRLMPPLMREKAPEDRSADLEIKGFLASLDAGVRGTLIFWHCQLPHFPFRRNPDGTLHGDTANEEFLGPGSQMKRPTPLGYSYGETMENYRKQVGYVDRVLGQVIDALKRLELYDRTTLVVTSDHGLRTWGATPSLTYPKEFPASIARIPLMIRGPHVKPGVYTADYQHLDFTPTLLDALRIPYDASSFEGVSVFAPSRPTRPRLLHDNHGRPLEFDPERDLLRSLKPE